MFQCDAPLSATPLAVLLPLHFKRASVSQLNWFTAVCLIQITVNYTLKVGTYHKHVGKTSCICCTCHQCVWLSGTGCCSHNGLILFPLIFFLSLLCALVCFAYGCILWMLDLYSETRMPVFRNDVLKHFR